MDFLHFGDLSLKQRCGLSPVVPAIKLLTILWFSNINLGIIFIFFVHQSSQGHKIKLIYKMIYFFPDLYIQETVVWLPSQ